MAIDKNNRDKKRVQSSKKRNTDKLHKKVLLSQAIKKTGATVPGRNKSMQNMRKLTPTQVGIRSFFKVIEKENNKKRINDDACKTDSIAEKDKEVIEKPSKVSEFVNIISWNVAGLLGRLLESDVTSFLKKHDFICLQETFLQYNFNTDIKFNNYSVTQSLAGRLSETGRPSGGVILLWKKKYDNLVECIDTKINNVVCIKIKKEMLRTSNDVFLINMYIHPCNSAYYKDKDFDNTLEAVEEFVSNILEENNEVSFVFASDANSRISDWSPTWSDREEVYINDEENMIHYERNCKDNIINNFGKKLIEFYTCFRMIPLNGLKCKQALKGYTCLLYTSPSPRDLSTSRMPSSA